MLIFQPEAYILPGAAFELGLDSPGLGAARLGRAGALAVARVAQGSCIVLGGEGAPVAGAGHMILLPGEASLSTVEGCRLEGLYLEGRLAGEVAAGMEEPLVFRPGAGAAALLAGLLEQGEAARPADDSCRAYELLCRLAEDAADGAEAGSISPLVAAAAHMINEGYGELYGVAELADELMVSKHHLIRCFSAEMGISPGKYLTAVRVENAKRLLLQPEFTLEMVAGMCGFSGANYMCKVFRQHTGDTPAGWRGRAAHTPPAGPLGRLEEQAYL